MLAPVPAAGSVAVALEELAAVWRFTPDDPRSVTLTMLRRLAVLFDERPSAQVARELSGQLRYLAEGPGEVWSKVDELRSRRAVRNAERLLHGSPNGDAS